MSFTLSLNTKAILLLTAPLLAGSNKQSADLIKPQEYKKLARYLREIKRQPADFLTNDARELITSCSHIVDQSRIERLIGRGFLLSQVVEHWKTSSIWVISRADPQYPKRLKRSLKEDAPALLYGCGDVKLLDFGGLAVVGPRKADDSLINYANEIGQLCAKAQRPLISGGAKGIDLAAMTGAQLTGGVVCNVMAENLENAAIKRENREYILHKKLVLVSAYDPKSIFSIGHAMQRNKLIYALSQAALVVDAMVNKGGTWAGANEQLEKLNLVPVYTRSSGFVSAGLEALKSKGAFSWPNPTSADDIIQILDTPHLLSRDSTMQITGSLFDKLNDGDLFHPETQTTVPLKPSHSERLYSTVRDILTEMLDKPMNQQEIADELNVSKSQALAWLTLLVQEGKVTKLTKPIRYIINS
nr:DNA-processing protein DprA [Moritella viscosa]